MSDPIRLIGALLDEIGAQADVEESTEWYLRSYLVDYKRVLLRKASGKEIEFATGALMRFCAQMSDTNAPLHKSCIRIAEEGAKLAVQLKAIGRGASS